MYYFKELPSYKFGEIEKQNFLQYFLVEKGLDPDFVERIYIKRVN